MTGGPLVAVVGRANVGKSTLVNRLLGRREAIEHPEPGVTRDRRAYEAEWDGVRFSIVDGLGRMGADIRGMPDGFIVKGPTKLGGAAVDAAGDHRIAMTLAAAALSAERETTISGWDSVAVSYPAFEQDLRHLVVP